MTEALDSLAGKDELTALQTRVSKWVSGGTLSRPAINTSSPVVDTTAADIATLTDPFRLYMRRWICCPATKIRNASNPKPLLH